MKNNVNKLKLSRTQRSIFLFSFVLFVLDLNAVNSRENRQLSIDVPNPSATEDLIFAGIAEINDDNSGSSLGNGNGQIDSGETIELQINLENTGTEDLTELSVSLSSSDLFT